MTSYGPKNPFPIEPLFEEQCAIRNQPIVENVASLSPKLDIAKSFANSPETRPVDLGSVHKMTCSFVRKCRVKK